MADPIMAVDVQGLRQLAKDLKTIGDKDLQKRFRKGLRRGAQVVADDAKSRASFSERIPGSIRVRTSRTGAAVYAGGDDAPHAVTFEGKVDGGNRRHPVFGRGDRSTWTWAEQPARPYMRPALNAKVEQVVKIVGDELEAAFTDNGWH